MTEQINISGYTVFIGDIYEALHTFLKKKGYSSLFVLTDENTARHCLPIFKDKVDFPFAEVTIPAGEEHKTLDSCKHIWQSLSEANADRKSLLINLGGGMAGDVGGFAAATYKRGISFIHLPTTLLAQADASVGGKVGVNFNSIKNQIGLFIDPEAVFIDPIFLKTLPERQLKNGFAEIVKHALIRDRLYWNKVQSIDFSRANWHKFIQLSVNIKKEIVEKDFLESGLRKVLNFGHTIGHALESFYNQKQTQLLHGEAIALGMIAEGFLSIQKTDFPEDDLKNMTAFFKKNYIFPKLNKGDHSILLELMRQDKKNTDNLIRFTLLEKIGEPRINITVADEEITAALNFLAETIKK